MKEISEELLIKSIDVEIALADRCEADTLFNKVLVYVRENYAEFMKIEDSSRLSCCIQSWYTSLSPLSGYYQLF